MGQRPRNAEAESRPTLKGSHNAIRQDSYSTLTGSGTVRVRRSPGALPGYFMNPLRGISALGAARTEVTVG